MVEGAIRFENGLPEYHGDQVVRCFLGNNNGLLFRIVNDNEYRWAFYNDTTNYNMTVHVSFGGLSKVEPLRNTKMKRNAYTTEYEFQVTVRPGETEMFMEGEPNGFKISFEAERIRGVKAAKKQEVVIAPKINNKEFSSSEEDLEKKVL